MGPISWENFLQHDRTTISNASRIHCRPQLEIASEKTGKKKRNNTHCGCSTILCGVEVFTCLVPGWYPLGMVPRTKPVALRCNVVIVISPPSLRHHERSCLSVFGLTVAIA